MLTFVRSLAFAVLVNLWTWTLAVLYLPLLWLPRVRLQRLGAFWCRGVVTLAWVICGIRYRVVGRENLPPGPVLIASTHQSAWDGVIFHVLLDDPVYVLKQELLRIPLFGLYLKFQGNVGIDRSAGARALRVMLPAVQTRLDEGAQVIVFPEGTRVAPDAHVAYNPGIAALYQRFDVPLIPVALNSGQRWGRRSFRKFPGLITVEFLPALPRGLSRATMLAELARRIEEACGRLDGSETASRQGADETSTTLTDSASSVISRPALTEAAAAATGTSNQRR